MHRQHRSKESIVIFTIEISSSRFFFFENKLNKQLLIWTSMLAGVAISRWGGERRNRSEVVKSMFVASDEVYNWKSRKKLGKTSFLRQLQELNSIAQQFGRNNGASVARTWQLWRKRCPHVPNARCNESEMMRIHCPTIVRVQWNLIKILNSIRV